MTIKPLHLIISTVLLLLCIPLIAMQFTAEVNWELMDFVVAGTLLLGTGFCINYFRTKLNNRLLKITLTIATVVMLLITWIQLAVGII
mgnify:CR=1 FL=1